MPDIFTDTSSQGIFSRLQGALAGLLIGPILIIGAIVLLSWNEGRAVTAIRGLADAATHVVEAQSTAVEPANNGKLIHVVGTATAAAPLQDTNVGVSFPAEVTVQRDTEMYQWVENEKSSSHTSLGGTKKTTTTYTYSQQWAPTQEDSSQFKHPEDHTNPSMPFGDARLVATDAKLGAFKLDGTTLGLIDPPQALVPQQLPTGWSNSDGHLYKGNPASPHVGDLRVTYHGLSSGATLSVLAEQSAAGFAPFTASNGFQVQLAEVGNRPAQVLLADKRSEESMLTWILRAVGALAMFLGFRLFFNPLDVLASVIPFLGRLVGGATTMLAFVISVPLTLVVIALAWLSVRPWIGGSLLVLAAAALIALGRWHFKRKHARALRATAAAAPPSMPPPLPPSMPPPVPGT